MAPPTKRRRRNVISSSPSASSSSDSEGVDITSNQKERYRNKKKQQNVEVSPIEEASPFVRPSQGRQLLLSPTKAQRNGTASKHLTRPSAREGNGSSKDERITLSSTSPVKRKSSTLKTESRKNGNISAFFSSQAVRQQNAVPRLRTSQRTIPERPSDEGISDDDYVADSISSTASTVAAAARKRLDAPADGSQPVPTPSQRFKLPPPPAKHTAIPLDEDTRPWADRFAPNDLDELCVHKRKVADVRNWLEAVVSGHMRQRLLILKGPAGAGKTLTVQLIAKEMGINIIEWQNPTSSISGKDGFVSFGAQLEEFLGRGGQYAALDLFEEGAAVPRSAEQNGPSQTAKNLMLIEEFPNTFTRSSTALHSFRSAILQYLAANMPSLHSYGLNRSNTTVTPLILIISETLLTTTSANADSFTAHRLLGQEILQHPGASVIEFNRIAPTLLQKALDLVLLKESRRSGRKKIPGPGVLKQLCESGDVRSAVGSLEFLCLHGDNADWSSKVAFGKTKRVAKAAPMTDMERGSLELITRREASLGIFHAVGKVVYNRRDDDSKEPLASENLAAHLTGKERPMKSKVEVDGLIDEIGTDTTTFLAALHENYLPSCDAPSPSDEQSLNHAISCIEALSDADLLSPSWDGSFNPGGFGGGTGGRASGGDVMRQDEIAFQTAVRGILFALPFPVKRKAPEGQSNASRRGFSADANKMFYPTSLKLWRRKEEIESLVDLSVMNMLRGDFAITQVNPLSSEDTMANTSIVLGTGTGVKTEILLDRLPYLLQVVRAKAVTPVRGGVKPTTIPIKIQDLEKVVKFTGIGRIGLHGNDEEEDGPPLDEGNIGDQWATDQLGDSPKRRIKPEGVKVLNGLESRLAASTIGNSTVLSDDDIEDFD